MSNPYYTKATSFSDSVQSNSCTSLDTELQAIQTGFDGVSAAVGIADGTITLAKLAAGVMVGDNIAISDPSNFWTVDTAQGVADQIGALVGTGGSLTAYVTRVKDSDLSFHATTANLCEVTIAANSAPNGVLITFGVNIGTPGGNTYVPLELKIGDAAYVALSSSGSPNPLYDVGLGSAGGNVCSFCLLSASTTPAWNPAVENKIRFGTAWGGGTTANFKISVLRLS